MSLGMDGNIMPPHSSVREVFQQLSVTAVARSEPPLIMPVLSEDREWDLQTYEISF